MGGSIAEVRNENNPKYGIRNMADITKCRGDGCIVKEKCYRYTAKDSSYQSYFVEVPFREGKCDMYWGENAEYIFNLLKKITNNGTNQAT